MKVLITGKIKQWELIQVFVQTQRIITSFKNNFIEWNMDYFSLIVWSCYPVTKIITNGCNLIQVQNYLLVFSANKLFCIQWNRVYFAKLLMACSRCEEILWSNNTFNTFLCDAKFYRHNFFSSNKVYNFFKKLKKNFFLNAYNIYIYIYIYIMKVFVKNWCYWNFKCYQYLDFLTNQAEWKNG